MGKVKDYYGNEVDFDAAMAIADRDICEELNDREWRGEQAYFEDYAEMHAERYDGEEFAPYWNHAW